MCKPKVKHSINKIVYGFQMTCVASGCSCVHGQRTWAGTVYARDVDIMEMAAAAGNADADD